MNRDRLWIMSLSLMLILAIAPALVASGQVPQRIVRLSLSIVLVGLGVYDLRFARVPNVVVMPLLVATIPLTAVRWMADEWGWGEAAIIFSTWVMCLSLWGLHAFGGGDAKLVMALIGLFPDNWLLLAILLGLLVGGTATLMVREGGAGLRRTGAILVTALAGRTLPKREAIREAYHRRGSPAALWISAGGFLYLWWIW